MLKRLTVAVAALIVLSSSAFGAGTVPGFSLAQQQDSNGAPLVACKLYTIQAGTVSTPQSGYQDSALTLPLSNPIICDAYGRLPQIFLADGSIKLRLTKSNGVQVFAADGILVVGASSGGGGGSPVDPTTILQTGAVLLFYGTGVKSGYVRTNARTIGSATSGATERANADGQALFEYLWGADANLSVSGGRGASANADWVANKTLTLPDGRGRVLAGLDDMGNTAASRYTGATFDAGTATTLGAALHGATIGQTNFPNISLSSAVKNLYGRKNTTLSNTSGTVLATDSISLSDPGGVRDVVDIGSQTISMGGSGTVLPTFSPSLLVTYYLKL